MGTVYRAFDERLQRDVAIKLLNADALANQNGHRLSMFPRPAAIVAPRLIDIMPRATTTPASDKIAHAITITCPGVCRAADRAVGGGEGRSRGSAMRNLRP